MKTIRNCGTIDQATSIKLLLEGNGIDAFIPDEVSAGVVPHFFNTKAGIRVQVADEDVQRANEILTDHSDS